MKQEDNVKGVKRKTRQRGKVRQMWGRRQRDRRHSHKEREGARMHARWMVRHENMVRMQ